MPEPFEFQALTPPLQRWWANIFPELEPYRRPGKNKFTCEHIFPDKTVCTKTFRTKTQAVQCREFHIIHERNERTRMSETPTTAGSPEKPVKSETI